MCPPIAAYSREFQAQAARELDLVPADGAVVAMIADYGVLRAQLRACR